MAVKPGDLLRERYRIDTLIGRGGMGQVFAATDLETQRRVAIKVVSRLLVDDVLMVRLHREAAAAQRIRSEYIPVVYEVSDTEEGETFLVMERLVGEPLSQRIRDNGALPWSEVRRIGEDVLRGLIDAHAAGVVHRDLKPSNVFLAARAENVRAMVLDFGVCKMDGIDAERLTGTGESIGTVAYMAPEQIRGASRVDARADLFAFGVLVFEMLSGRLPHEGPSQMAILASKLERPGARLRDFARVAIPDGIDELVAHVLQRDPDARIQTAKETLQRWHALANARMSGAAGPDQGLRVDWEPPTEISRPSNDFPRSPESSISQRSLPRAPESAISQRSEPFPTQLALTTQHATGRRAHGSSRAALYLAAFALVIGVVVVGVAMRGPPPAAVHATTSAPAVSDEPNPPAASASAPADPIELPETAASAGTKPKLRPRPRPAPPPPPVAKTAEKPSGPHFTSAPRF